MTGPRYILHPCFVRSRADGDRHYVGVEALLRLYSVPRDAIVVVAGDLGFRDAPGDVHLYPRSSGNYRLPVVAPAPLEPAECCPHNADFDFALAAGRLQSGL